MKFLTEGKTNWKYILIVAVLAVIVGGGILGCQNWWFSRQKVDLPVVEVPERHEKEDWNVYTSKEYGFEIDYPKDWKILHEGYYKQNIPYGVSFAPQNWEGSQAAPIVLLVHEEELEVASKAEGFEQLKSEKEITVNGVRSKEQIRIGPEGEFKTVFVPTEEGLAYELRYNNPEFKDFFSQILSTFRFIE